MAWRRTIAAAGVAVAALMAAALPAAAGELPLDLFPGGERLGPIEGTPAAAAVYRGGRLAGYVASTRAAVGSTGYSGKPLDVAIAIDLDARIVAARLIEHSEPILVIGIPPERLAAFVAAIAGHDLRAPAVARRTVGGRGSPDVLAGATVSSVIIRDAAIRTARAVARTRGLLGGTAPAQRQLDRETLGSASWEELRAEGAVARLEADQSAARAALGGAVAVAAPDVIDLYAALATPPRIGESLVGRRAYAEAASAAGADGNVILLAGRGIYSFKGTQWARSGVFERVQLVQGARTIALTREMHRPLEVLAVKDGPALRELALFVLPASSGYDPLAPWRIDLLVAGAGAGAPAVLSLPYRLPDRYVRGAPAASAAQPAEPVGDPGPQLPWRAMWEMRVVDVAILAAIIAAGGVVLVFQDFVTRSVRRWQAVRTGLLAVTLIWLGWWAGAQLSVVNVLTFVHSLMSGFRWESFLIEPLIFVLWSMVAVALLFWGRGVFCGWLCPFGALQELLNAAARALGVRQFAVPFALHERLWPIKYVIALGIFAVSLHSMELAVRLAEVEPFKTAITLRFDREWPYLLYVAALLGAGLSVERFFCRYLCPLGAALAIPARLRMFEWLKRKHQCGRECHICAVRCTVQAIHPSGQINPNECVYCLQCQVLYNDDRVCPPLIARRKRHEERAALLERSAAPRRSDG